MFRIVAFFLALLPLAATAETLPFDIVFKGSSTFERLLARADEWKDLPIGERTAAVGRALCGTPYKGFTLEIDDRIEAPSVNLTGLDCWTFFESSLAFARLLYAPREQWTPQMMLRYIEHDRYRGGHCDGTYLSRLHYLEDWLADNERRSMVSDLTRSLGGVRARHEATEMTRGWKSYRYMVNNLDLREGIARMEQRVGEMPLYYIPKGSVAAIEPRLQSGDIIGICSRNGRGIDTSHVGLALRTGDGVLHFMHASSPRNFGKVLIDARLSDYLARYSAEVGILVARPLR